MSSPLKIGITCYPSVGGSGILASALGEELARLGHEIHFISYERPFRMPANAPRLFFHPVDVSDYGLFKYPDYTLPLSVKMAEVSREHRLDILHVHYAVPHATAALLARDMLPPELRPKIVATLHGTDTTLLGRDPAYAPAITHALHGADAITTVSHFLKRETQRLLGVERPIDVIHNFFTPRTPKESREAIRSSLGVKQDQALILHASNLRPLKRIDLLLETAARIRPADAFKLVILAGGDFEPFLPDVLRLGLQDRIIVRTNVPDIEDYFAAADLALFTSETESFCLGILEAMAFACPSVATDVGGIPEVIDHDLNGLRVPFGDPDALARAVESLLAAPARRAAFGHAAREKARTAFSAATIVPQYLALYNRVSSSGT
jgi:L-malate glycosyltransferase